MNGLASSLLSVRREAGRGTRLEVRGGAKGLGAAALIASLASLGIVDSARAVDPWADAVVDYAPGAGSTLPTPASAVGSPSRFTPDTTNPDWSSVVSPFAGPYLGDQVVSIGAGGSLTLRFDEPVTNDAANPYGVDLLVFGNAFYAYNFGTGTTTGALGGTNPSGVIEVSQDGVAWSTVPSVRPDALFPTLAYLDLADPFSPVMGLVETDFTRPVNPAFNAAGMNFTQIIAGYDGSGGGVGVDLALVSLPSISFVRFSLPAGATGTIEIDGVSDVAVPAPSALALGLLALPLSRRRRR